MTLFVKQIVAGADDVGILHGTSPPFSDSFNPTLVFNQLGEGGSSPPGLLTQDIAARFTNVTIPQGATINSATITFIPAPVGQSASSNVSLFLVAHDVDNSSQLVNLADYLARILVVTASVPYNTGPSLWVGNVPEVTPDIASVIQAIVNRPGWASGNAMNIFTRSDGVNLNREARVTMFETSPGSSIQLDIDFTGAPALPPTILSLNPTSGITSGGTVVTITGTDFVSGATVTFGGTPATLVNFINSTTLEATTPAKAAGAVDVVVTNPDAQFDTLVNGYTYVAPTILDIITTLNSDNGFHRVSPSPVFGVNVGGVENFGNTVGASGAGVWTVFRGVAIKGSTISVAFVTYTPATTRNVTTCNTRLSVALADDQPPPTNQAEFDAIVFGSQILWNNVPGFTIDVPENTVSLVSIFQDLANRVNFADDKVMLRNEDTAQASSLGAFRQVNVATPAGKEILLHLEFTPGTGPSPIFASGFQDGAQQSTQVVLVDILADFLASGVEIGFTLKNITDGSEGLVDLVTKNSLTTVLAGGTNDLWQPGDSYEVIA